MRETKIVILTRGTTTDSLSDHIWINEWKSWESLKLDSSNFNNRKILYFTPDSNKDINYTIVVLPREYLLSDEELGWDLNIAEDDLRFKFFENLAEFICKTFNLKKVDNLTLFVLIHGIGGYFDEEEREVFLEAMEKYNDCEISDENLCVFSYSAVAGFVSFDDSEDLIETIDMKIKEAISNILRSKSRDELEEKFNELVNMLNSHIS